MAELKESSTRAEKLIEYLVGIIDELVTGEYQINADMLSNDVNNYSIDKIPTASTIERWITGDEIHRDVFDFRSRNHYSQDSYTNLLNVGFFEKFEQIINSNNKKGVLPNIKGIESIECLNSASLAMHTDNTAEFSIQIQITYREEEN